MLQSWSISNFKSFEGTTNLALRKLTLMCGANSSGKSSVLQSILLVKQTLQYAPPSRAIALNGALVRLGIFSDIENFNTRRSSSDHSISLGWKISNINSKGQSELFSSLSEEVRSVSVNFTFDTKGEANDQNNLELQPILKDTSLKADFCDNEGQEHCLNLSLARSTGVGRKLLYNTSTFAESANFKAYKIVYVDDDTAIRAKEGLPSAQIAGSNTTHFVPSDIVVRFDRSKFIARNLAARLTGLRLAQRRWTGANVQVPSDIIDIVRQAIVPDTLTLQRVQTALSRIIEPDEAGNVTYYELSNRLLSLPPIARRTILERISKHRTEIESSFYKLLGKELTVTAANVDTLRTANAINSNFFRFAVRYLGPLRDEPRPSYPLQALSSPTDVGPKGELTAAVLHLNEKRSITYVPSHCFSADDILDKKTETSLKAATIDWLSYLGVAVDVETNEKGKFGHELRIKGATDDDFQDLTNVGVGVSQVLPIIVTCLLAPVGATIILEQPELHLHPKVQARLADFFISMTKLDKQCVIETHGEHLIERLRLRIVCDLADKVLSDTQIYFFDRVGGSTSCQEVKLNNYGSILNWPTDFFDQSQKESQQIVMKALERRKRASPQKTDAAKM